MSYEAESEVGGARPVAAPVMVDVHGLRRVFDGRTVLDDVDLQIRRGEFVALLGPSGTGKTTLLRLLAGLDTADAGQVTVPRQRSVVFQEPRLIPALNVWRNVVLGARRAGRERPRALARLDEVGLRDHAQSWPFTLSGGEAQRVALARALVTEPKLLLLDEPFASLDALTRLRMHDLVGELCDRYRPAVLLVTHDVDEALVLADRVMVINGGRIGLDLRLDTPRPRERSDATFLQLRARLLAELGVSHSDREADSLPLTSSTTT